GAESRPISCSAGGNWGLRRFLSGSRVLSGPICKEICNFLRLRRDGSDLSGTLRSPSPSKPPSGGGDAVHRDIRLALRLLWKEPAYAATAILTLAICLGANTALFTIVNSILLKPLPVPRSDRILLMSNRYPYAGGPGPARSTNSGVPDYYDRLRT